MSTFKCFEFHNLRAGPTGPVPVAEDQGSGVTLGPILPEHLFPKTVPLNYLIIEKPIPICHPDFIDPLNWEGQGSFLCFPSASKSEMVEWLEMWEEHFTERFRNQKILRFFRMSVADKNCDPRVCSAMLPFWNSAVNCFYFPEGPMSVTLADVKILTRCKINGCPVRQYSQAGDINPKGALQYMEVVNRHLKMASAGKKSDEKLSTEGFGAQEEVEFLSTWLSKFVYCFPGKKVSHTSYAVANFLRETNEEISWGPFVLGILYHDLDRATSQIKPFPKHPAGGLLWLVHLWSAMWMPGLTGFKGPSSPLESSYYGETILDQCCQRKDQWLMTSITGHLKHIVDFGRVDRRNWAPFPGSKTFAQEINLQAARGFWNGVLTRRDLPVIFDGYLTFEVYNPQLCARQFGFIQSVAVPLADPAGGLCGDRMKRIACKSINPNTLDLLNQKMQLSQMEFPSDTFACFATQFFTVLWSTTYEELRALMHFLEVSKEPDFYTDDAHIKARGSTLPSGPGNPTPKAPLAPASSRLKSTSKGKAKVASPREIAAGDPSKARSKNAPKRKAAEEEDLEEMPLSQRKRLVKVATSSRRSPNIAAATPSRSPTAAAATPSRSPSASAATSSTKAPAAVPVSSAVVDASQRPAAEERHTPEALAQGQVTLDVTILVDPPTQSTREEENQAIPSPPVQTPTPAMARPKRVKVPAGRQKIPTPPSSSDESSEDILPSEDPAAATSRSTKDPWVKLHEDIEELCQLLLIDPLGVNEFRMMQKLLKRIEASPRVTDEILGACKSFRSTYWTRWRDYDADLRILESTDSKIQSTNEARGQASKAAQDARQRLVDVQEKLTEAERQIEFYTNLKNDLTQQLASINTQEIEELEANAEKDREKVVDLYAQQNKLNAKRRARESLVLDFREVGGLWKLDL
ncbi:hypothetical protein MLD38_027211 [Melastoma candidum]|uniref:Uncharacterized protein n=1 Tax=Melastoma candidum TaxID=119954 RepID=A0ACB9P2D2_9MYRT|nr:hypothetical protein MLD38_027211 [Melastoma candidum]